MARHARPGACTPVRVTAKSVEASKKPAVAGVFEKLRFFNPAGELMIPAWDHWYFIGKYQKGTSPPGVSGGEESGDPAPATPASSSSETSIA